MGWNEEYACLGGDVGFVCCSHWLVFIEPLLPLTLTSLREGVGGKDWGFWLKLWLGIMTLVVLATGGPALSSWVREFGGVSRCHVELG